MKTSDFEIKYPHPDQVGIDTLYRFSSFNQNQLDRINHLFVSGKLYHSTPDNFNDPFECKPHFRWPSNPNDVKTIRKHLINVAINDGNSRKEAQKLVSNFMRYRENVERSILNAAIVKFNIIRVCCFTIDHRNLLFWSHYANSHKGFCVGFNSKVEPISYAFKVRYQDEYPEIKYPEYDLQKQFEPALIKSTEWKYEEEFRTFIVQGVIDQPNNDGESFILKGNEIKSVYFGARMAEDEKNIIEQIISDGPFSPSTYDTRLSRDSFKLDFHERN